MQRFVSKRSSSSVDLDFSSLDDVRAERAAIALSQLATPASGSTGNVLSRSTSSTTMSFRVVSAYSSEAGGNQQTPSPDCSHARRPPASALRVPPRPPRPLHSLKSAQQQHGKTPQKKKSHLHHISASLLSRVLARSRFSMSLTNRPRHPDSGEPLFFCDGLKKCGHKVISSQALTVRVT